MSRYSNQEINGQMCVWLQSHGWQPAVLGSELKVGDTLVYNWGHTSEIISIDKETAKTITISVRSNYGLDKDKVYNNIRIKKSTYKPIIM